MTVKQLLYGVTTYGIPPETEVNGVTDDITDCENKLLLVKRREDIGKIRDFSFAVIPYEYGTTEGIRVDNIRKTECAVYANLYGNPQNRLKIIGVTGTNGKTTTALLISHILNKNGVRCAFCGTVDDSGYTTPPPKILYKRIKEYADSGCTHLAMEVSSHGIAQHRIDAINFELGVLTNVSRDHLDYHGSMEYYIKEKASLFLRCKKKLINADTGYFEHFNFPDKITYGIEKGDFCAKSMILKNDGVEYMLNGERVLFPVIGEISVYNSLAAVSAADILGIGLKSAVKAVSDFKGVCGRMEKIDTPLDGEVYIDYAHTPDGIIKLMNALRPLCRGRLIILMGCGGERDRGKRPEMCRAASEKADFVIITSDNPRKENPYSIIREMLSGLTDTPFAVIEDRKKAIEFALSQLMRGDMLVLAGKGHEKYQQLADGSVPFDEREIIRKFTEKLKK